MMKFITTAPHMQPLNRFGLMYLWLVKSQPPIASAKSASELPGCKLRITQSDYRGLAFEDVISSEAGLIIQCIKKHLIGDRHFAVITGASRRESGVVIRPPPRLPEPVGSGGRLRYITVLLLSPHPLKFRHLNCTFIMATVARSFRPLARAVQSCPSTHKTLPSRTYRK